MNIVYTWHSAKKVRWYNKDFEIKTLIVSLNQSLKFFNRVTLYTDVKSFEELKNYTLPKIEVVFKKRVEHNLWVLDKIATYELQTKPFLHIYSDFIFTKNPSEKFLNSEVGFQSLDSFDKCEFYEKKLKKIKLLNIYKEEFIPYSFNFGVYLCNNISLNKDYCTMAKNAAKKLIENTSSLLSYNVIVEQYTMSEVLNNKKTYPSFLIENYTEEQAEKTGFIHILNNKNNKNYYETIQKKYI